MKSKTLVYFLIGGIVGYVAYKWWTGRKPVLAAPKVQPKAPLPEGTAMTGKIQTTTNNRPPNWQGDVVGAGIRDWAEVTGPSGNTSWVEIESE